MAFVAGWLIGGSGRSGAELSAGRAIERAAFFEARAHALEGRVHLLQGTFGEARAAFDLTARALERLQQRLRETGQAERAGQLEVALAFLRDATEQAGVSDVDARNAAEAALRAIETVAGS